MINMERWWCKLKNGLINAYSPLQSINEFKSLGVPKYFAPHGGKSGHWAEV